MKTKIADFWIGYFFVIRRKKVEYYNDAEINEEVIKWYKEVIIYIRSGQDQHGKERRRGYSAGNSFNG